MLTNKSVSLFFLVVLAFSNVCPAAKGQTNEWVWMNGPKTPQVAVYGTLGTASAQNIPGNRTSAVSWTDNNGNLWLFGGNGYTSAGVAGYLNDLWNYNPSANQWVWMGGASTLDHSLSVASGVSGTIGTPDTGNIPQGRSGSASWKDAQGNLWLFSGSNYNNYLSDLWRFNPSTREWTWMGGLSPDSCPASCQKKGIYGALNTPAPGNFPGARRDAVNWTDSHGNFWLFGGTGYDSTGGYGYLNDLWEFNPSTNQWTWMGGSNMVPSGCNPGYCGQPGMYGAQGIPTSTSTPGGRGSASGWTDSQGNLWLFGGLGLDSAGTLGILNDLWKYNSSTSQWTWVSGSSTYPASCGGNYSTCGVSGVYGTQNVPAAANFPGARQGAVGWGDSQGNLWVFGGNGIDSLSKQGSLNDLWEYSLSSDQWTWISGSSTVICADIYCGQPGVYGTLETPALGNTPSGREYPSTWVDSKGNFWLFGGTGVNIANTTGQFQDLWEFQLSPGGLTAAATPVFSPDSGTYTTVRTVTISDGTPGATISYLINGNPPATQYTEPIMVSSSETIQAIAQASGYANSRIATASYTLNVSPAATPTFSPVPGTYATAQTVTISDANAGATIYYTTDGTMPTTSSTIYTGLITISSPETIQAIAVASGLPNSAVGSAVYSVGPDTNLGKWVWVSVSSGENQSGVYGTLQTPSTANNPGGRAQSTSWADATGIVW